MNIVFYNFFNNGDIHMSRGFVRYLVQKISSTSPTTQFSYAHKNDPNLLSDIPNLTYSRNFLHCVTDAKNGTFVKGNTIFINTWYGSDKYKFMNRYSLSFDTLYTLFEETCTRYLGFSLQEVNPIELYPSIDFKSFEILHIDKFLESFPGPKVLVANGFAQSGQADNFNLGSVINELANKYHGITFILTENESNLTMRSNMMYSRDIIKKSSGSDLNENAYLALSCNLLIGRASGVHSYCINRENVFNRNNFLLSFSNLSYPDQFWLHEKFNSIIKYSSTIDNVDINNSLAAKEKIDDYIKKIWVK